jgi:hypothetical protein
MEKAQFSENLTNILLGYTQFELIPTKQETLFFCWPTGRVIPHGLRQLKLNHHMHNSFLMVLILSQLNPFTPYIISIHMLSSTPHQRLSTASFPLRFLKNIYRQVS